MKFIIKEKLPSLNEWVTKLNRNRFAGANFKKDVQTLIGNYIEEAKENGELEQVSFPCILSFEWHEKTKKRDLDNIASAKKFILDALVEQGILIDDSRKYVRGFYDKVINDKENFVVVEILECL